MTAHTDFEALGLSPTTLKALAQAEYRTPTPIQAQTIPAGLRGDDVIGCAATGTGKTAAFLLPIIERLVGLTGIKALVLAPTRELALQIAEHAERFGRPHQVRTAALIGGVSMKPQLQALRQAQLVVATPGRLIDHMEQGTLTLSGVAVLVLDEADRMLDMGFKPQLDRILAKVPRARQTMLFSATMAGEVASFAKAHSRNPVRVEVAKSGTTAAKATQCVYEVGQHEKTALLVTLLSQGEESTLVFTRTKRRADKLTKSIKRSGFAAERIHADRSQGQRQEALEGFKKGRYRVLVATDIAARGIDVAEIGHVVNFDLPNIPADYVHRIGRTARAQASGHASSFVSPDEVPFLRDIEKLTRSLVPRMAVPRDSEAFIKAQADEKARGAAASGSSEGHRHHRSSPGGHRGGGGGGGRSKQGGSGQRRSSGGGGGGGGESKAASPSGQPARTVFRGGPKRR